MTVQELLDRINALVAADPTIAQRGVLTPDEECGTYKQADTVYTAELGRLPYLVELYTESSDRAKKPFLIIT